MTAPRRTLALATLTTSAALAHADSAAADGAAEVLSSSTVWPLLVVVAALPTAVSVALLACAAPDARHWPLAARFLSTYTLVIGVANVVRSLDWFALTPSDHLMTIANLAALTLTTAAIAALAWTGRHGTLRSFAALAAASLITMLVYGAKFLDVMHHPPASLTLPDLVHRLTVAASYTFPIPALTTLAIVARRQARRYGSTTHPSPTP